MIVSKIFDPSPQDPISRYLFYSKDFNVKTGIIKHQRFLPHPDDDKTSVFMIHDLDLDTIWALGDSIRTDRNARAFAKLKVADITELQLSFEPDNKPPRHGCIAEWPSDEGERKRICLRLAERASLVVREG